MKVQKTILGTVGYMGGVPTVGEYFAWSLANMIQYNCEYLVGPNTGIYYDRALTSFHANARNDMVKRMRGDWLLQLDTDHLFEPDLLARLLLRMEKYGVDVVTGLYTYKEPPYAPVLYHFTEDKRIAPLGSWDKEADIFQVDSAGAGCLLAKRSVFEKILAQTGEWPFDCRLGLTEDHSFFVRLKECDIKAYCVPSVECHHVRPQALSIQDYDTRRIVLGSPYLRSGAI